MVPSSFCILPLLWPEPIISIVCTKGTPAPNIVAIWRVTTAISAGVIFLSPPIPNKGFAFLLILPGVIPCLRS